MLERSVQCVWIRSQKTIKVHWVKNEALHFGLMFEDSSVQSSTLAPEFVNALHIQRGTDERDSFWMLRTVVQFQIIVIVFAFVRRGELSMSHASIRLRFQRVEAN